MRRARKIRRLIASACMTAMISGVLPHPAAAQATNFPSKPIRIVIPFAAGGFADITMRVLADKLGERLSQRVIIENRPGGGGVVAAQAVTSFAGRRLHAVRAGRRHRDQRRAIQVAAVRRREGFRADLDRRAFRHAVAD